MASIYDDIRSAFEVNLAAISGIPSIAWENVSFSPTTGQPYVHVRMVPTVREPATRGQNPQMYYQGYFLVTCCVPEGTGPSAGDTLANLIIDSFEATTDIFYDIAGNVLLTEDEFNILLESGDNLLLDNTTRVSIRYVERDLGVQEGSHYHIPVRIGWYIYH